MESYIGVAKEDIGVNGEFICPEGILGIVNGAFSNVRENIKRIILPKSIKELYEKEFIYCHDLVSLNIPEGIKYVNLQPFSQENHMLSSEFVKEGILCWGEPVAQWQKLELPKGITVSLGNNKSEEFQDGLLVVNVDNLEEMIENNQYISNKPVILNIKNVSELSTEKLAVLSSKCNIQKIQIIDIKSQGYESREVYCPYDIDTYKKCREVIDTLLRKIDIEKYKKMPNGEKIIFGKIVKELSYITYDTEAWRKGIRKILSRNLEGGLLSGTCVCVGYSEIIRNILACCGIDAKLITARGHCWNQVKLDGDWYHADFTFDQNRIRKSKKPKFLLRSDKDFLGHSKMLLEFKRNKEKMSGYYIPSEYKRFDVEPCNKTIPTDEILQYIYGNILQSEEGTKLYNGYYIPQQKSSKNLKLYNNILSYIKAHRINLSEIVSAKSFFINSQKKTGEKDGRY